MLEKKWRGWRVQREMKVEDSRRTGGENINGLLADYKGCQGGGEVRKITRWSVYLVNGQTFQPFQGSRWSIFPGLF